MKTKCIECGKMTQRTNFRFCSNKCQRNYQYKEYILKWNKGEVDGSRGITTKNISANIKRYLLTKYNNRCVLCGWNKKHPITGKVPLEIDHIDGNAENNKEENLRLLCPNCHSLTPNYRRLNNGKGRIWRKLKYIKQAVTTASLAQR